ncbi:MAG: LolA family protein [Alphaproteobacteria bacterium]
MKIITITITILLMFAGLDVLNAAEPEKTSRELFKFSKPNEYTIPALEFEEIGRIEAYLNNINTMVADFVQIDANGTELSGKFFLSRPGKLRWQYNPPSPILIVVNGSLLSHYDFDLDQISHVSAEDSLASFLTRKLIKLSSDIKVNDLLTSKGTIRINLVKKGKEEEGELILIFNENPIELKKIELQDSVGQLTSISLYNIRKEIELPKDLFILKNPKFFKNKIY